ncbi:MAG: Gfo/Idh/MocA family oxidoreductase [Synergistaceae bacterium]|nr:Gfo/Idh/MocA family oxidoreductase [Synergistaceae bacterium]
MKAALIGYGYWGKILEKYIASCRDFELVSICKITPPPVSNLADVLANDEINAVFVCTPSRTHYEICKKLLRSGKHVFCEKPLVMNPGEAEKLYEFASVSGKILYADYIYTVSASIQDCKEILKQLGKLICIEGEISQFGRFYSGETAADIIGVHLFSVLGLWFPEDEASNINVIINSGEVMLMSCEIRGIKILLKCNLLCPGQKVRRFDIFGENGRLSIDLSGNEWTLRLQNFTRTGAGEYKFIDEIKEFHDERNNIDKAISEFAECIKTGSVKANRDIAFKTDKLLMKLRRMNN